MLTDIKSSLLKSETGYVLVNVSDKNLSTKWISIYDEDAKNKPMSQRKIDQADNEEVNNIFIVNEEL